MQRFLLRRLHPYQPKHP
ncbi:unnamed protein product [Linum tenue]|uniref:Uncharacterized protein n=1 Tax=Linum tenue TaxID=586396 RepID=A0AAV0IWW1_9ROSI|nr:unnamed protein product [Linum tenue]